MSQPSSATAVYTPDDTASALVRVLDEYVSQLKEGRAPSKDELLAAHPELAGELESCLDALDFIHRTEHVEGGTPTRLGDFEIVREIGRGGMGVVYEAEQASLKRRVALKVLRFGGAAEAEALQRFQREAETVARLHHTNIVPVYSVGCEQGVYYYAMQLIDGEGLDRAAARMKPSFAQVAGWGRQAAEALAHAHQRGIIHRDIKPSNLLLDNEGIVWLTDFGLAHRADEATLTATGLLLGTPRYMSPEQASAAKRPIDARSDVYSLGATLYELATGRPVYNGDTPQRLLAQIMQTEPLPPRHHRPDFPRDLDTILLRCLAKEPESRYATAQDLAEDLRRFVSGDAIRARRPTLRERATRWVRKHSNSSAVAAVAAVLVLAVTLGAFFLSRRVERWLKGTLFLATDGPVLTAEVLTPEGEPAGPRFTVPTEEPVAFPAGDYLLRLRGRGFLDETYQVRLERGFERAFDVGLAEQRLWEPLTLARCYEPVEGKDHANVAILEANGVTLRDGNSGAVLWTKVLEGSSEPKLAGFRWDWDTRGSPSGRGEKDRRPRLIHPAPDLDGDGIPDLVWASQRQAALLALSGKDGKLLWCRQAPPPRLPANSRFAEERASSGIVLGAPALFDVNGDGVPDLIVTCAQQEQADGSVPRWIEALSGKSGESLWRYDLDAKWFVPPAGQRVPNDCRWDNQIGISYSSSGGAFFGPDMLYEKDFVDDRGGLSVPYPAVIIRLGKRSVVAVSAGTRLTLLDPKTGQATVPALDLGVWPIRTPQFADLDGDGNLKAVLLGEGAAEKRAEPAFKPDARETKPPAFSLPFGRQPSKDDRLALTAVALPDGKTLWNQTLRGYWGWNWFQEPFDWPVLADLDGDGKAEIIVPTGDFSGETTWSGVEVRDPATGNVRWRTKLTVSSRFGHLQQVNRMLVGPDVDGDGVRDLFVAVLDGQDFPVDQPYSSIKVLNFDKDYQKPILRVDALSGRDGHTLWWSTEALRHGSLANSPKPSVGALRWWHAGDDGWPQLVVPYEYEPHEHYLYSAGTGRLLHRTAAMSDVRVADLDGDGVPDLISFVPDRGDVFDRGGQLLAVRGRSPEAWRRLGGLWRPIADLDGDGVVDFLGMPPPEFREYEEKPRRRDAAARATDPADKMPTRIVSGRDGKILWQTKINDGRPLANWQDSRYERVVSAGVDLDGDGIPDLLATGKVHCYHSSTEEFSPLVALSGKTGKRLWAADFKVESWIGPQLLECADLDGDGKPEVLFISASTWDWPRGPNGSRSSNDWQYWLAILDGSNGRVKWRQPLADRNTSDRNGGPAWTPFSFVVTDLDGDGSPDLAVEGGLPESDGEVRAFRGRDGAPLWTWKPARRNLDNGQFRAGRPVLTSATLRGRKAVVVLHTTTANDANGHPEQHAEILALDAQNGRELWSWKHLVTYEYNDHSNGAVKSRAEPTIVRLGNGRHGICVPTDNYDERGQLTLLDEDGKEIRRIGVDFRLDQKERQYQRKNPTIRCQAVYSPNFRVWRHDLDGDGVDEVVILTEASLRVLTGDLAGVKWERPLPDTACELFAIWPAATSQPATIVLRTGNRVLGLRGSDGQVLWSSAGSGTPVAALPAGAAGDWPRVLFDLEEQATVCRYGQPASELGGAAGFVPYRAPDRDDPRFVRPLPWNAAKDLPPLVPQSPWLLTAFLGTLAFVVLAVPVWLSWHVLRRRRWWLVPAPVVWLALAWAGLGVLYVVELNNDASWRVSQGGWWNFLWDIGKQFAIWSPLGLPVIAFLFCLLRWLRRDHWRRSLVLVLVSAVCATAVGIVWVRIAGRELGDELRFSHRGWWNIAPAGIFVTGMLILIGWPLLALWRLTRRLLRRTRNVAPAGGGLVLAQ
jgi:tRNA A-37 threonylcarbamoyl transferase component Bud32